MKTITNAEVKSSRCSLRTQRKRTKSNRVVVRSMKHAQAKPLCPLMPPELKVRCIERGCETCPVKAVAKKLAEQNPHHRKPFADVGSIYHHPLRS